ncbi:MAG: aromatic amino acid lyase, partial [Planctomycetota bacterium]
MDVKLLKLNPGSLSHAELESFFWEVVDSVELSERCWIDVENSRKVVDDLIEKGETVYGLNTGFGLLANKKISTEDLAKLQINLVRSHSAGTGALLDSQIVRLIMLLKATSLARGFSGIRKDAIQLLMECINRNWIPSIPEKGSVGASGDLAPLAHLSLALVGEGEFLPADGMSNRAQPVLAKQLFEEHCVQPLQLEAKEGLALLNGTQVSTALAIAALYRAKRTFRAALIVGALSVDAAKGSDTPFDARIHEIRNHQSQIKCAELYRKLLAGSKIRDSHRDCSRVQDPYSLRCQPQVMGACLNSLEHAASVLIDEANAVSDNPLVFSDDGS